MKDKHNEVGEGHKENEHSNYLFGLNPILENFQLVSLAWGGRDTFWEYLRGMFIFRSEIWMLGCLTG